MVACKIVNTTGESRDRFEEQLRQLQELAARRGAAVSTR
jgi:hypothetical protein